MKNLFSLILLSATTLSFGADADPAPQSEYIPPSPEVIQSELNTAQEDFDTARLMFNPWYAGPLITGGGTNLAPGLGNVQPYLYFTDTYATYSSNRKLKNMPDVWTINPVYLFQTGVTSWLDTTVSIQGIFNNKRGKWASNIGDTNWGIGLQIATETPYRPAFRATITETFPTGKYEFLDPSKADIDGTGAGSYQTNFGLNISKVIWQLSPLHPMQFRVNFNYKIPSVVHVREFNTYGGGYGTDGKVRPGNVFNVDLGWEFSFTQKWVFALDVVYNYFNKASFSGEKGISPDGSVASMGGPSGDQLSFAPALEYNPSSTFGYVAGVWFSATGRNTGAFASGVLTFYAVF